MIILEILRQKQIKSCRADFRFPKAQAGDARVERHRAREHSTSDIYKVIFANYLDLREGRVAALDALQQLPAEGPDARLQRQGQGVQVAQQP